MTPKASRSKTAASTSRSGRNRPMGVGKQWPTFGIPTLRLRRVPRKSSPFEPARLSRMRIPGSVRREASVAVSASRSSLPTIHVPARIYPLPFAEYKDFGDAAGLVDVLAAGLEFVRVVRIDDCGETVNLDFGFGKL